MVKNITIDQARKKLGEKAKDMTDKQVGQILEVLYILCDRVVKSVIGEDGNGR